MKNMLSSSTVLLSLCPGNDIISKKHMILRFQYSCRRLSSCNCHALSCITDSRTLLQLYVMSIMFVLNVRYSKERSPHLL